MSTPTSSGAEPQGGETEPQGAGAESQGAGAEPQGAAERSSVSTSGDGAESQGAGAESTERSSVSTLGDGAEPRGCGAERLSATRQRRNRLIALATLSGSAARVVTLGVHLVQLPVALHYLGTEAFGLWMTLVGTVQLLSFADLGLGLGLQNKISAAFGRDDQQAIRDLLYTGRRLLAQIGLALLALGLPLCLLLPWGSYFNVQNHALAPQTGPALAVVFAGFALGLPLMAGVRFATGLQLGWVNGLGTCVTSALTLLAVFLGGALRVPFTAFVAMTVAPTLLVNWGVGLMAARSLGPIFSQLRPVYRADIVGDLRRQGVLFLMPQLSTSALAAAPAVMLSSVLGPAAVTPFSVCYRLGTAAFSLIFIPVNSLWPAYAEAQSRGDHAWILRTFKRSLLYTTSMGLLTGAGLVLVGEPLILLWTRQEAAVPTPGALLAFGAWIAVTGTFASIIVFLNGSGILKGQALGGALAALAMVLCTPPLIAWLGVTGAVLGMLLSWMALSCPLMLRDLRRALRRAQESHAEHLARPAAARGDAEAS
ncbi:MAG: lipopolysaccharide biosynthesis protein [Polyangiaceae bacterium]|nr:lipopolysaccharide biosynthesis protein [Polyangiaceae bacterium]MCW5791048.1 lipopolysaccharide biosynthesis protein [Polyangiaceae bacterium]